MAQFMVPVKGEPGTFFVPSLGRKVRLVEYYWGQKYDTVVLSSGAVTAGTQRNLFRDLTNKDKTDTNFTTSRRIGNGEEMIIRWIGAQVEDAAGNTPAVPRDVKRILWGSFLEFRINRSLAAEGTLIYFPAGVGLSGQTTENDAGVVSNGVPATASVRQFEKPQEITDKHDLDGVITFHDHLWDTTNLPTQTNRSFIRVSLVGLVKEGATRS